MGLDIIPKRRDFLAAAKAARVARAGVVVQMRDRHDDAPPRLGITASRKVGNAVQRNRAKRRLRAAGQALLSQHGKQGHDYVLIARYNTNQLAWGDLERALTQAISSLNRDEKTPHAKYRQT